MQLNLSGSIFFGVSLFCMLLIAGVGSAGELDVNLVSQYVEDTSSDSIITNALMTQGQDFSSHLGGSISNVAVVGNYAYLGQGQDMLVVDITDVSDPLEVGRITTPSLVNNVAVSGNYAYVANGENGLLIVDITNKATPTIKGNYTSGSAYGVAVSENYAYVADGEDGLVIVDVSDPASPTLEDVYDTAGDASGVVVSGDYAYVADGTNGLVVVDIADPSSPSLEGTCDTAGDASDVAVSGNYAYVADDTSGLAIINIANPSSPTLADSYDTANHALGVAVSGSYAYVADGDGSSLVIVNITDPAAASSAAVYSATEGYAYDVAVSGNYAYVAYGRSGLAIVNVTTPAAPTFAGKYDLAGYASGVAISGNYAYVANGYMGLSVINISDKSSPTSAGRYITPGYARDVAFAGSYAYVANDNSGLVIVDVHNPAVPTLKGSYDTSGRSWGVAISGNYAYVADGAGGLVIVDITNPALPTLKGSCDTPGNAETVAISGNYAYVADGDSGLAIVDITNLAVPVLENSYNTAGHAYGITVIDQYAYVADGSDGLVILDITTPTSPSLVGSYDTNFAQNLAISGNYAYIADDSHGLVIANITSPATPTLAGSYNTAGYGYGVAVSGNYVYVADFNNGLVILQVDTGDITAPASVTGLNEIGTGSSWIRWTWIDPSDDDFSHAMVYLDGAFVTNASAGSYNLTGLAEGTSHMISTRTVDASGNINSTWVNDSATTIVSTDIVPPAPVTSLGETHADSDWINWTWVNPTDADFSHAMIYIDGTFITNTSDSSINSYNATGLSDGVTYTISMRTADTSGNINSVWVNDSATTVKLPEVSGLSGTNITKTSITVTWEASDDTTRVQISRNDMILGNVSGSTYYVDSNLTSSTTYGYTLVPYNNDGLEGEAVSVSLRTRSGSSGGGSGGSSSSGGSGGAASVEDFANLAMKDVANAYLMMDSNVTYQFTRESNAIQSVSFYSLKNSGQTTATIEMLNNRSKLVNSTPEGSIYEYLNIWVGKAGFATAANIKDVQIEFKVNTSWIREMGISPENVRLQRYNGNAWEVLPTTMDSNTTGYVIFKSQTPGFSPFAITAEKALPTSSNGDLGTDIGSNEPFPVQTEDVPEEQAQPERSIPGISIVDILAIGVVVLGYVYLKRKQN
ncbi:PGF-pre-PGF domain-containing protein [Methanomethylovorans sp.]|uniref:PGF-pre-PGF domain-containing protein n=1 Tax=Methanomethylovorans sp. TaxID=2758717 RepID=UPI00351C597F